MSTPIDNPVDIIPPENASVEPAPVEPASVESASVEPASVEPASVESAPVEKNVIGVDLTTKLGGLTTNMVAIACQHKMSKLTSSPLNNFEKELKSYTSVKLLGAQQNDIEILNTNDSPSLSDNVKCYVLDTGANRNLTEIQDAKKDNYKKLFALIKKSIASDADIDTGAIRSSKRKDIVALESELKTLSGIDIKFAAATNACTQIVFGFDMEGDEVNNVVGRIQSVGSGITGIVQTGDFKMVIEGDNYVISAAKDSVVTISYLLKKILGLTKDITTKGAEGAEVEDAVEGAEVAPIEGGKTRNKRHHKKGTRKHKPKRTMKNQKPKRKRSLKK